MRRTHEPRHVERRDRRLVNGTHYQTEIWNPFIVIPAAGTLVHVTALPGCSNAQDVVVTSVFVLGVIEKMRGKTMTGVAEVIMQSQAITSDNIMITWAEQWWNMLLHCSVTELADDWNLHHIIFTFRNQLLSVTVLLCIWAEAKPWRASLLSWHISIYSNISIITTYKEQTRRHFAGLHFTVVKYKRNVTEEQRFVATCNH